MSFELQPDERRLLDAGVPVAVGPRAFDLLVALVERAGHLVTKDELLDRVWPKVIVEEAALQMQISSLRKILGRDAIVTVTARGYRFALEATCVGVEEVLASTAPTHNLPQPLSSFVGREQQVQELKDLLRGTRLLTLIGSGGCGKTRLAMHTAAGLTGEYPDGVWVVELAALADPQLVPDAVARVFGQKEQPGTPLVRTIVDHLASRNLLLVLDNAEHVLEACAQLSYALLSACPALRMLVTSRERLGIVGELTYRVPSLSMPDREEQGTPERLAHFESARLFIERAQLQQPRFVVTPENAPSLASICRRLDGIPLAIELAAARVRLMPVEEVGRRLDQRFDLLTGGSRTALPRHRTLRSLIDWSYDLLNGAEQELLCRASIFSGGWTLEAAERVCAGDGIDEKDVLDLLTSLADKSLVNARDAGGETRYELLETVRHYARDRLWNRGGEARLSHRHFDCMLALAEMAESRLKSGDQQVWLERLETEHENLRAALAWSCANDGSAADGLRLASSLGWFWSTRGHYSEGRRWLSILIAAVPGGQEDSVRAYALRGASSLTSHQGDYAEANRLNEEALAIFRRVGDRKGISQVLNNMATDAFNLGNYTAARLMLDESMTIRTELDDQHGVSLVLSNLGIIALDLENFEEARSLFERGLAIQRALGNPRTIVLLTVNLGCALRELGDYPSAEAMLGEALAISGKLANRLQTASCLEELAALAAARAQPMRAAGLWGRAQWLREGIGSPLPDRSKPLYNRQVAAARTALADDAAFDAAWKEGRDKPIEQVLRALRERRAVHQG
ncbi:ATP-binding protein [Rhizobacter sp. P5_C2]